MTQALGVAFVPESFNEHFEQSLIDWALVDEDHYTDSELNQLELDGKITYWATEIERVT